MCVPLASLLLTFAPQGGDQLSIALPYGATRCTLMYRSVAHSPASHSCVPLHCAAHRTCTHTTAAHSASLHRSRMPYIAKRGSRQSSALQYFDGTQRIELHSIFQRRRHRTAEGAAQRSTKRQTGYGDAANHHAHSARAAAHTRGRALHSGIRHTPPKPPKHDIVGGVLHAAAHFLLRQADASLSGSTQ